MAIRTVFTERFQVTHPLVLAPMGGVSGGMLAAAVSNAGGFGLVGGGYGDPRWLERELETVVGSTSKPWGVGLITWAVHEDIVRLALSYRPAAVFLSFGDPARFASLVRQAGARLIGVWTGPALIRAVHCAIPSWTPGTGARQNWEQTLTPGTGSPAVIRPGTPTSAWSGPGKGST